MSLINNLKNKVQAIKNEAVDTTKLVKKDSSSIIKARITNNITKKNKPICNIIWYGIPILMIICMLYLFHKSEMDQLSFWNFLGIIIATGIALFSLRCIKQYQLQKAGILMDTIGNIKEAWNRIINKANEIIENKNNHYSNDVIISARNLMPNVKRIIDEAEEIEVYIAQIWLTGFWLDANILHRKWIEVFDKITDTILDDINRVWKDMKLYVDKMDILVRNEV